MPGGGVRVRWKHLLPGVSPHLTAPGASKSPPWCTGLLGHLYTACTGRSGVGGQAFSTVVKLSRPPLEPDSSLLLVLALEGSAGYSVMALLTPCGDLDWVPSYELKHGPTIATVGFWGVNPQMGALLSRVSLPLN